MMSQTKYHIGNDKKNVEEPNESTQKTENFTSEPKKKMV